MKQPAITERDLLDLYERRQQEFGDQTPLVASCWVVLLARYVANNANDNLIKADLSDISRMPHTTADRYLAILECERLIESKNDAENEFRLSEKAHQIMDNLFAQD